MAGRKKLMTFPERLAKWAEGIRKQACQLPPGPERDALLKKARQTEIAAHLDEWANSPGLQPPK
ncbi:hypothetical protein [Bradyrhizobium erythrophlei]|jgi:hypothetical protein|uniref:Uncharacterized protein n=1 Tax=Bradyrhizobium erythrophlei TaxID=1437360 RepID=A0A1M7USN3_9BRAD|nr:hypothetical protein [Bradyrhizobium erythrophlei]SHN86011.1 hypothetical protein SAMN05444170_6522 [Bradyrhizobium erythrophlei]